MWNARSVGVMSDGRIGGGRMSGGMGLNGWNNMGWGSHKGVLSRHQGPFHAHSGLGKSHGVISNRKISYHGNKHSGNHGDRHDLRDELDVDKIKVRKFKKGHQDVDKKSVFHYHIRVPY